MRYIKIFLVVLVFAAFIPLAHSQDDSIPIKDIGKHQRPLVVFNHKLHGKRSNCSRCHHDFDANLNNQDSEGHSCDSCHERRADGRMPSVEDAFHLECIRCKTSREDLLTYGYDACIYEYIPDAVVFPKSSLETSNIMKAASAHHVFITPRGVGSGLGAETLAKCGGACRSASPTWNLWKWRCLRLLWRRGRFSA